MAGGRFSTSCRVEKGHLFVRNKRRMDATVKALRDGEYVLTIERAHAHRSQLQNAFYWSVVIPRIQEAFKTKGIQAHRDPKLTNEVLKSQFMDPELVRTGAINGFLSDTGLLIGTHTSDLNKLQFIEYLERVVDHAAEYWDTYVPPPNPNWKEQAEREAVAQDPRDTMRREKGHAA